MQSDSETDDKSNSNDEENASSHREEEVISEYEKQRLERIKENKARLEALRLPSLASSLLGSIKNKGKTKEKKKRGKEEDEEYQPSDGEERASSSTNEEEEEEKGDEEEDESSETSNRKGKSRQSSHKSKSKEKRYVQKRRRKLDYVDDDEALQQAIALSLEDSSEVSGAVLLESLHNSRTGVTDVELEERKRRPLVQEIDKRKKKRQSNTSRVQMTEDQAIIHFFQFDELHAEAGKGGITVKDLRRVAIDHDFIWSDKEINDMVHLFDSDGDGKLHLDDFRKILHRCNMIKG